MVLLVSESMVLDDMSTNKRKGCFSDICLISFFIPQAPGSLFVIENPPRIVKFIADNNMPIMILHKPVKAVRVVGNITIPPRVPVPSSDLQHAFFLVGAKLTLWNCNPEKVKGCGGLLCDAVGGNPSKCACMSINDRECTMVLRCEIHVSPTETGTKFSAFTSRDFTSKRFTKSLVKNSYIPHGFNVTSLVNDRRELKKLINCIQEVLKYNNERGGYNIAGWIRKGRQLDPGAVQPTSQYEPKIYIPSGDITYHITSVTPTGPTYTEQEKEELNNRMYNMEAFGTVEVQVADGGAGLGNN